MDELLCMGAVDLLQIGPGGPASLDAHSAITQRGRSGESYDRTAGPSKVRRGSREIGFKYPLRMQAVIIDKPRYVVQRDIRLPVEIEPGNVQELSWWYHPDTPGITRVFSRGDNVAELDFGMTMSYLNGAWLGDPRQVEQVRRALETEVSLAQAQRPDNPHRLEIVDNLHILRQMYRNHEKRLPIMPCSVYTLFEPKE